MRAMRPLAMLLAGLLPSCEAVAGLDEFRAPSEGGSLGCRALQFDGADDGVYVPDHPELDGLEYMTIEAWIRPRGEPTEAHILSHHDQAARQGYVLLINSNGALQFRYYFGGSAYAVGPTVVPFGGFHHVAAVRDVETDTSKMMLFVDGLLTRQRSDVLGTSDDFEGPLVIGRTAAPTDVTRVHAFEGLIYEVRLSRIARYREPFQIQATPFEVDDDTVALWRFDDLDQTVRDATGVHHGTLGSSEEKGPDDPTPVAIPCRSEF